MTKTCQNIESPFTELFSLIGRMENKQNQFNKSHELKAIKLHTDNAMGVVLQGIKNVGELMAKSNVKTNDLGYFISGMGNLAEALYMIKDDVDYILHN